MNAVPSWHVLVVEDDPSIRQLLRTILQTENYSVHEAASAAEAEAIAQARPMDLFIIDLGLPDSNGVDLIRRLRRWCHKPIVVLSARQLEHHKVDALDAGADDYIVKPFGPHELHARLRVAQRHARARTDTTASTLLHFGDLRLDLDARLLSSGDVPVALTPVQWRLLEVLARRAGRVVTARQLLTEVWGPDHTEHRHYLRIYVRQLRQRLEPDPPRPRYLLNEAGVGYRLVPDAAPADSLNQPINQPLPDS